MDILNNPHDNMFKEFLKKKQNVEDLLRNALPKELVDKINFSSLEYPGNSYVDDKLKEDFSDFIVKAKIKEENCYFYILFEHKSYSQRFSLFQLLKYMIKIWNEEINNKREYLTPIVPILFYQTGHKWTSGNNFNIYFKNVDDILKFYVPNINYLIYDLKSLNDEEVKGSLWFSSTIILMKYIRGLKPVLNNIIDYILNNIDISEGYPQDLIVIVFYILNACTKSDEDYVKTLLKDKMEDIYMSIAKELKEEGIKEGIKEGMEKGERKKAIETAKKMKEEKLSLDLIEKITGLTKEDIDKL